MPRPHREARRAARHRPRPHFFTRNSKVLRHWARTVINIAPFHGNNCDTLVIASGKNNDFAEFTPFCITLNTATMMYELEDGIDLEKWHKEISSEGGGRYSKGKGQTAGELLRLVDVGEVVPKERLEARAKEFGITQRNFPAFLKELQASGELFVHLEKRPNLRPRPLISRSPFTDEEGEAGGDEEGELDLNELGW